MPNSMKSRMFNQWSVCFILMLISLPFFLSPFRIKPVYFYSYINNLRAFTLVIVIIPIENLISLSSILTQSLSLSAPAPFHPHSLSRSLSPHFSQVGAFQPFKSRFLYKHNFTIHFVASFVYFSSLVIATSTSSFHKMYGCIYSYVNVIDHFSLQLKW